MPLQINVKPYELTGVLIGDQYMTHYKAKDAKNDDFVITEFAPSYMTQRNVDDNTTLDVTERFIHEYDDGKEEFIRRMTALRDIRDASLHPVVEIFERNNTAYLVRRVCNLTPVETYLSGQQMDWHEAYHFVRPLILSMAQAAEQQVFFQFGLPDLRVNSYRQVVLAGLPTWDTEFEPSLIMIAKLYYRLVTGVEAAAQDAPGFSVFGVEIPPRLEAMIMEILSGDILYGSLDDFYRKFKSLVDGNEDADSGKGVRTVKILKSVAAVLAVMFMFSLVGLAYSYVGAHRASVAWADPNIFAGTEIIIHDFDFTATAQTHPRNASDTLVGSFGVHEGFLFSRGSGGMMRRRVDGMMVIPGATGLVATEEDWLILSGSQPSFMLSHGRYLYFVDSNAGNTLFRMMFNGTELTQITDYPVMHIAALGDFLFYTNPERSYHMYRIYLNTMESELYLPMQALYTISDGERLFFLSDVGTDHSGLYVLDPVASQVTGLVGGVGLGLRLQNEYLYYLDAWGRVRVIDKNGVQMAIYSPENVRNFDIFAQFIAFTEEGRHAPRIYNTQTGVFETLSNTEWVSYIWMHDGIIYAVDHRDPSLIHTFHLE